MQMNVFGKTEISSRWMFLGKLKYHPNECFSENWKIIQMNVFRKTERSSRWKFSGKRKNHQDGYFPENWNIIQLTSTRSSSLYHQSMIHLSCMSSCWSNCGSPHSCLITSATVIAFLPASLPNSGQCFEALREIFFGKSMEPCVPLPTHEWGTQ